MKMRPFAILIELRATYLCTVRIQSDDGDGHRRYLFQHTTNTAEIICATIMVGMIRGGRKGDDSGGGTVAYYCSNIQSTMTPSSSKKRQRLTLHHALAMFIPLLFVCTLLINKESRIIQRHWVPNSNDSSYYTLPSDNDNTMMIMNPYSIKPGGLPGYTGWSRPEQTLAGYFDIEPLSHPTTTAAAVMTTTGNTKYHAITMSGDIFSLLLTCNHNRTSTSHRNSGVNNDDSIVNETLMDEPSSYYECPEYGGSLFYVRAYGPSVITGIVTDMHNSSYSVNMKFIDPGEYTIEVVITFSVPMDYDEFPLVSGKDESLLEEPGYEGYMVSGFPLQILVVSNKKSSLSLSSSQRLTNKKKDKDVVKTKPWCTLSQLTETSTVSALYKGYWQVIDNVAHMSHAQLTPDETSVSLDGYRMGLNSLGYRMRYVYTDCELIHIHNLARAMIDGGMDQCLNENLYFNIIHNSSIVDSGTVNVEDNTFTTANAIGNVNVNKQERGSVYKDNIFEGIHVIFIGDSVMRLVMSFFLKLVHKSHGFKVTFIETNGGIHSTIQNVTLTLEHIRTREMSMNVKRVILFNSGLHDIDILCSSKRSRTRSKTYVTTQAVSCQDAYRIAMTKLITVLDEYPAEMKVFRSTTAGWQKYGNYGFSWPATDMQPMSRSPHLAHHFNTIAYDIIQKQSSTIQIVDGYWLTLPRPDHTQTSSGNEVGKHMVHPGFEVLSVFARMWFMIIFWGICGTSFDSCMKCIGGRGQ